MKRVLFVIPYLSEGGAQRAISNIVRNLPDDWETDILVNSELSRKYPIKGNVISLNIDKHARTSSLWSQISSFCKRVFYLRKLKDKNEYKACVSFIDSANVANILSSRLGGNKEMKTIVSVRTSLREASKRQVQYRFIVRPLARILYRKADIVVSASEELRRELIDDLKIDKDRVVAITNGFDINEIRQLSKEDLDIVYKERLSGKRIVFTAGRLNIAKNQWHLIRAFSYVKRAIPNSVLVIAGTGELEDYLKGIAEGLGLIEDVIFLGFEKNVYRYSFNSDVFVLPSAFEGFPNALGEALCVGVPCIATDFKTGARELLAPELLFDNTVVEKVTECKYGILTPVCSGIKYGVNDTLEKAEIELANSIIRLISEDQTSKKYRRMSAKRAEDLDIKSAVKKWIDIIEG